MALSSYDALAADRKVKAVLYYFVFMAVGLGITFAVVWFVVLPALDIDPSEKQPSPMPHNVKVSFLLAFLILVTSLLSAFILWIQFCKRSFKRTDVAWFLKSLTPVDQWIFNLIWREPTIIEPDGDESGGSDEP